VVAHAFVTGGEGSESERSLVQVGGSDQVDKEVFDGYSYVALGHLHRPQEVGSPTVAYSGTPLAYSFSEDHAKSMRLVTMSPDGQVEVEKLPIQTGRPVVTLEGSLDEILTGDEYAKYKNYFVRAKLSDSVMQPSAMDKLRVRFKHVLELEYLSLDTGETTKLGKGDFKNRPGVVVRTFWEDVTGDPPSSSVERLLDAAVRVGFAEEGAV